MRLGGQSPFSSSCLDGLNSAREFIGLLGNCSIKIGRATRLFHGAFETQLHYRVEFWIYFFNPSDVLANNSLT